MLQTSLYGQGARPVISLAWHASGDLTHDGRKGLHISCNCLNLPSRIETEDGRSLTYNYLADGTLVSVVDGDGHGRRYRYAGKEEQRLGGLDVELLDFGARYYDPFTARWTSIDPMAGAYLGMTPYGYCGGDPINRVEINGMAWQPQMSDGTITGFVWIPLENSYNKDGTLKDGLYEQAIFFTDNGTFDSNGGYNIGSSTAIVYLSNGTTESYEACTHPSTTKYACVPSGRYEASVGIHNGSKSSYTALKMFDVGKGLGNNIINLGGQNPAHPEQDYIKGADIHKPGLNNLTGLTKDGSAISEGCFLIDRNKWDSFISSFDKSSRICIGVERK